MIENIIIGVFVILFCLLQVYLVHLYFDNFAQKKVNNLFFVVISFFLMGLIKVLPSDTNMVIKAGTFILALNIIVFTSYGGNRTQKAFHIIYFSLIMLLSDLCLSLIVSNFTNIFYSYKGSILMTVIYFGFNFLSLLLSFGIVRLLVYFKVDVSLNLNNKEYCLIGVIPFCSLLCIMAIDKFKTLSLLECYLFLLVVNVCIMLLYFKILRKSIIEQNYILIKKENAYYQSYLSNQKEIIQLNHDLKNILLNLDLHLENNKVCEARKQIAELIDTSSTKHRISGCIPIDAILNSKIATCIASEIKYEINIQFPHDININSIDLAAILGNLLDNAIEANLRITEIEKRKVLIGMKYDNEKLVFKITNACNFLESNFSKDKFRSEKFMGRYGIGLGSVKDRINRLGGYCDFSCENYQFYSFVVIPLANI